MCSTKFSVSTVRSTSHERLQTRNLSREKRGYERFATATFANSKENIKKLGLIRRKDKSIMKHKKQILQFLKDNHCMINSLMSKEERKTFDGDVVSIIENDIQKQINMQTNYVNDNNDLLVQFAVLWGNHIGSVHSSTDANKMKQWDSEELLNLFSAWKNEYLSQDAIEDSVDFFNKKLSDLL